MIFGIQHFFFFLNRKGEAKEVRLFGRRGKSSHLIKAKMDNDEGAPLPRTLEAANTSINYFLFSANSTSVMVDQRAFENMDERGTPSPTDEEIEPLIEMQPFQSAGNSMSDAPFIVPSSTTPQRKASVHHVPHNHTSTPTDEGRSAPCVRRHSQAFSGGIETTRSMEEQQLPGLPIRSGQLALDVGLDSDMPSEVAAHFADEHCASAVVVMPAPQDAEPMSRIISPKSIMEKFKQKKKKRASGTSGTSSTSGGCESEGALPETELVQPLQVDVANDDDVIVQNVTSLPSGSLQSEIEQTPRHGNPSRSDKNVTTMSPTHRAGCAVMVDTQSNQLPANGSSDCDLMNIGEKQSRSGECSSARGSTDDESVTQRAAEVIAQAGGKQSFMKIMKDLYHRDETME